MTDIDSLKEDERIMLRSECYRLGHLNITYRAELDRLRADLAQMTELLREYGGHHDGCDGKFGEEYRCRCRWREESAVLASTAEQNREGEGG